MQDLIKRVESITEKVIIKDTKLTNLYRYMDSLGIKTDDIDAIANGTTDDLDREFLLTDNFVNAMENANDITGGTKVATWLATEVTCGRCNKELEFECIKTNEDGECLESQAKPHQCKRSFSFYIDWTSESVTVDAFDEDEASEIAWDKVNDNVGKYVTDFELNLDEYAEDTYGDKMDYLTKQSTRKS